MVKTIAIIQGHPDPAGGHFCHTLADAYAEGARSAGHEVAQIDVANLDFPLLRTQREFEEDEPKHDIKNAQEVIQNAQHLLIIYPLWLGTIPALLKGFIEQVFRPGFAFDYEPKGRWRRHLKGRSARVVITMGMPPFVYRWFFRAHSLKSLERNILWFVGIGPTRETLIGAMDAMDDAKRRKWLAKLSEYGRRGI